MNNLKKILMCLSLVVCLSFSVACGGNNSPDDTSQDNSSADNVADDNDSSNDAVEVTDEDGNTITTTLADSDNTSEENYVTDADGSVVTDANGNVFVTEAVTNSDGSVVTDDSGNTVTQKVTVTTTANNSANNNNNANNTDSNSANNNASTQADNNASNDNSNNNNNANNNSNGNNTNDNNNNNNNNNNNATTTVANNNQADGNNNQTNAVLTVTENNGNIVATTTTVADNSPYFAKNRYSAFTWMSEDTKNVYNSGEIVQITFKVLDGAKAGTYPVEISYTDISNEKAELLTFPAINGTITVGDTNKVETQGAASSTSFRLDNGYAKVGDTVTLKMYLDNNPGISIFQVEFKYDNNALEVQSITPSGIFANESILSNMNFNLKSN